MTKLSNIPPIVGICIGLIIYELRPICYFFITPNTLPSFVNLLGLMIVFFYLLRSKSHGTSQMTASYVFLIFWSVIMVLRGSLMGNFPLAFGGSLSGVISSFLFNPYSGAAYLIPLMAMVKVNLNSLYYIKRISVFLSLFFIIMMFFERQQIVIGQVTKGMTSLIDTNGEFITVRGLLSLLSPGFGLIVFSLFNSGYYKERFTAILPLIVMIVYFISQAIGGGRGATTTSLLYILAYFFIMTRYPVSVNGRPTSVSSQKRATKMSNIFLGFAFILLVVYMYNRTSVFDYVLERAFGGKAITSDFDTSNRDLLKSDFIKDFNSNPTDWIWGRGVNGYYHTSNEFSVNNNREAMEWGYLYLILKGGVVYLILTVLCFIHAARLGFFKSRNTLSKALAMICLFHLYGLTSVAVQPNYSVRYLIPWLSFGLLELSQLRMLSDQDIYGYFNIKNYKSSDPKSIVI